MVAILQDNLELLMEKCQRLHERRRGRMISPTGFARGDTQLVMGRDTRLRLMAAPQRQIARVLDRSITLVTPRSICALVLHEHAMATIQSHLEERGQLEDALRVGQPVSRGGENVSRDGKFSSSRKPFMPLARWRNGYPSPALHNPDTPARPRA